MTGAGLCTNQCKTPRFLYKNVMQNEKQVTVPWTMNKQITSFTRVILKVNNVLI